MANESSVLKVVAAATTKKVTGTIALVSEAGRPLLPALTGAATTRDTVRAEVGAGVPIGALYSSSAGKLYLKVADAGATADWQKVTATAAD